MKRIKFSNGKYIEAKTKDEIIEKVLRQRKTSGFHMSSGRNYTASAFFSHTSDDYVVFNIHKKNRKMSPDKKKVVSESYWYGYVYVIPAAIIRGATHAKLQQKNRNFIFELTI